MNIRRVLTTSKRRRILSRDVTVPGMYISTSLAMVLLIQKRAVVKEAAWGSATLALRA